MKAAAEIEQKAARFLWENGAADIRVEHGGKHPKLVWTYQGRTMSHILSASPSDTNAAFILLRDLRRMLGVTSTRAPRQPRAKRRDVSRETPHGIALPPPAGRPHRTASAGRFFPTLEFAFENPGVWASAA